MESSLARCALGIATFAALLFAAPLPDASASAADEAFHDCSFAKDGLGKGECQHFLRNPSGASDDPCWCDKCRTGITGQKHDGHTMPPGWNPDLFERGGLDCYLKRHAVAWGINCSACVQSERPWPDGTNEKNPGTAPAKDFLGRPARETVLIRLSKEARLVKKPEEMLVAYNRHFYVVTDVEAIKVRMPSGSSRVATRHEWAHLMIERAEYARREFTRNLGPLMTESQSEKITDPIPKIPIAVIFTDKQRDYERLSAAYFKGAANKGLVGAGALVCDGMCLTGLGGSKELIGDDHELVAWMRHRLGHNLMSLWGSWQTRPRSMPVWMYEGVAQWLTKSIPQFEDDAIICVGEAASTSAGGPPDYGEKDWDKDVVKYVQTGKLSIVELMLAKNEVAQLTEEDFKRSWSYVDLCLKEWREPFVKVLRDLRQEKDVREAFVGNLGLTPEQFDERWRDRILARRKSMATTAADAGTDANDTPGSRDRRAIRAETEPKVLAAKIRELSEIKDVKTIPVVVDTLARNNDLIRETSFVTLLKTKDKACLEALANSGLGHADGIVRAYTARLCGRLRLTDAISRLKVQLGDRNWYARAEAAVALGVMKDTGAMSGMRKMVDSDPAEKARVGAMDALAMFGTDAATAVPVISKQLGHAQWQIRIAAAQALGEIGSMESVDPLIVRMEQESGRVRDDIYAALKRITRDDLGRNPENWRKWWDSAKASSPGGGLPGRPALPDETKKPKGPDPNDPRATRDSAPAPYFGVEIYSNRVAFVLDTTETMLTLFNPDPTGPQALARAYVGRDKLTICKEEIAQALGGLDPRSHFNIITFGMQIRPYKQNPVPASKGNVDDAIGFLRSLAGAGRTNYYGALKAALDIGDEPDTDANFRATPDVVTFLTDGMPNEGDIIDADTLLEWYTGLNRYSRVKTHTITFGLVNTDVPLLRGMADRNWGKFTIVPELKRKK